MNKVYALLLMMLVACALLLPERSSAQITVYQDSSSFDDAVSAELEEIDFEDMYSLTLQRVKMRNVQVLNSYGDFDTAGNPIRWLDFHHGAWMTFPTRTRRVSLSGGFFWGGYTFVTNFNDSTYRVEMNIDPETFYASSVDLSDPAGIKRIDFRGEDDLGNDDVNWGFSLRGLQIFDDADSMLVDTTTADLPAETTFINSFPLAHFDTTDTGDIKTVSYLGVTFTDPYSVWPYFTFGGFNVRADADSPTGNLGLALNPGATIDFPEGIEGALLVIEPLLAPDSVFFEVTDWNGVVDTIMAVGKDSVVKQIETPPLPTFLGVTSVAGIKQIRYFGLLGEYGDFAISTVFLAQAPERDVQLLAARVVDLDTVGVFRNGENTLLQDKLDAAYAAIGQNDRASAIAQLELFKNDVGRLFDRKILVVEEARMFNDQAEYVIERLGRVSSGVRAAVDASNGSSLGDAYPSPASDVVTIPFTLGTDTGTGVELRVANVRGELVRTIDLGHRPQGAQTTRWDGRDASGALLPAGIYFYTIKAGGFSATRSLQIVR